MTRRAPEKLSLIRWLQKRAIEVASKISDVAEQGVAEATSILKTTDDRLGITERTKKLGDQLEATGKQLDAQFDVVAKVKHGYGVAEAATTVAFERMAVASHDIGLTDAVHKYVVSPTKSAAADISDAASKNEMIRDTVSLGQSVYSAARVTIKPYFKAADAHELLRNTKVELSYVSACILQISATESSALAGQFSRALTAKLAGAGSTAALLALVSSLGSASTGTAIATLSGATATKATLAWVGGMIGGGMAAGAFLTGGVTIVVGLAAYKALASDPRAFESLTAFEQQLIQACWVLIAVCDSYLEKDVAEFRSRDARLLLDESFKPLYTELTTNVDVLCASLDTKNAAAFRGQALCDFRCEVLDGFEHWLSWTGAVGSSKLAGPSGVSAEDLVGGVFYALMTQHPLDDSIESHLMLDALRRSRTDLSSASEHDLGEYLRAQPQETLKRVAENVKGIYHELAWAEHYNATHSGSYAEVFESTNHPGSDVMIRDAISHEPLDEIQLKAVDSTGHVYEHIHRYPDIPVAATDEIADRMVDENVIRSGYSNESLRATTYDDLNAIHDHTIANRASDAALLSLGISSARDFVQMLRGEKAFPDAVMNTASKVATVAATTALTALLFS